MGEAEPKSNQTDPMNLRHDRLELFGHGDRHLAAAIRDLPPDDTLCDGRRCRRSSSTT